MSSHAATRLGIESCHAKNLDFVLELTEVCTTPPATLLYWTWATRRTFRLSFHVTLVDSSLYPTVKPKPKSCNSLLSFGQSTLQAKHGATNTTSLQCNTSHLPYAWPRPSLHSQHHNYRSTRQMRAKSVLVGCLVWHTRTRSAIRSSTSFCHACSQDQQLKGAPCHMWLPIVDVKDLFVFVCFGQWAFCLHLYMATWSYLVFVTNSAQVNAQLYNRSELTTSTWDTLVVPKICWSKRAALSMVSTCHFGFLFSLSCT